MDEPATLFFRCSQGHSAVVLYGDRAQQCPGNGSLLGIELAGAAETMRLSVEADASTEWELSIEAHSVAPVASPASG